MLNVVLAEVQLKETVYKDSSKYFVKLKNKPYICSNFNSISEMIVRLKNIEIMLRTTEKHIDNEVSIKHSLPYCYFLLNIKNRD